jgi:bacterioferritin
VRHKEQVLDTTKSIALLNKAVADELSAVHQYMYFHFHLSDQGFGPLSTLFRVTAIQEMGHVERLAERILFLGGDVEMAVAEPVQKITDAVEMLAKAAAMERQSAADYNSAAVECSGNQDSVSKQLFESLVADEERHCEEFTLQMEHIRRFGPTYLALQSFRQGPPAAAAAE